MAAASTLRFLPNRENAKVSGKRRTRTTTRRPITVFLPREPPAEGGDRSPEKGVDAERWETGDGPTDERSGCRSLRHLSEHISAAASSPRAATKTPTGGGKAEESPEGLRHEAKRHPLPIPLLCRDPRSSLSWSSSGKFESLDGRVPDASTERGVPPPEALRPGSAGPSQGSSSLRRDIPTEAPKKNGSSRRSVESIRHCLEGSQEMDAVGTRCTSLDVRSSKGDSRSECRPGHEAHEKSLRAAVPQASRRSRSPRDLPGEQLASMKGTKAVVEPMSEKNEWSIVNSATHGVRPPLGSRGSGTEQNLWVGRDALISTPYDRGPGKNGITKKRFVRKVRSDISKRADRRSSSQSTAEILMSPPVSPFKSHAPQLLETEDNGPVTRKEPFPGRMPKFRERGRTHLSKEVMESLAISRARQNSVENIVPPAQFNPLRSSTPMATRWASLTRSKDDKVSLRREEAPNLSGKESCAMASAVRERHPKAENGTLRKGTSGRSRVATAKTHPRPTREGDIWRGPDNRLEESGTLTDTEERSQRGPEGDPPVVHLWKGREGKRQGSDISGLDICLTAVRLVLADFRARCHGNGSEQWFDLLRLRLEDRLLVKVDAVKEYASIVRETREMKVAVRGLCGAFRDADDRLRRAVARHERLRIHVTGPNPLDYCFRALEEGFPS